MRLATVVGQTHDCYFLNKLSSLCNFVISTWAFSSFNSCLILINDHKNINYSEKNLFCIDIAYFCIAFA